MQAFGYDYDAIDGTHPTALGMKQMASMFIRGMEQADPKLPRTPYEGARSVLRPDAKRRVLHEALRWLRIRTRNRKQLVARLREATG